MPATSLDSIHKFLNVKRLAIVGVSRNEKDYSRLVLEELRGRGYEVIPINPGANSIAGLPCFDQAGAIRPAPEAAILLVPDERILEATRQCLEAGVRHLWFRHSENTSGIHGKAVAEAKAARANVVTGECPIMFLPEVGWVHRAHGFLRHVTGTYPS